jgi:glyoxylase-like metal-dependent hydrolase (beta-lactamase superfamily II)
VTATPDDWGLLQVSESVYRFQDTCNVYVIRSGDQAVLVDFGAGSVVDVLPKIGVFRITAVLMTHHHRDQGQGLARALAVGAQVLVPHAEQDLFSHVDTHWQARELLNNYNMRQDRFSLLEPITVSGLLRDYSRVTLGDHTFYVLPTPGHTTGSITLLATIDGRDLAFTGDLIAAPGKLWSLAATQWSYNGAEGVAASVASLCDLKEHQPQMLLPSHGVPIVQPVPAIDLLVDRLAQLLAARQQNPRLFLLMAEPYERLTPHLLHNRTSMANSYVLLSETGLALVIDFGYDFVTGIAAGADRASRRPWLYTLRALKRDFGVQQIEVAIPTHYHDDHVAGLNLLREVEGTQVWAAENFSRILQRPTDHDLPCLWYDPIEIDRELPLETAFDWHEYSFTLYPLPGHTRYAVAISFEVDGVRVVATGDQYQGAAGDGWNYVYQNGFTPGDYRASADLFRRLRPDLVVSGHWSPLWATADWHQRLESGGLLLEQLHHDLLPLEDVNSGSSGFGARIQPYQSQVCAGQPHSILVHIVNPAERSVAAVVRLVTPAGWQVTPAVAMVPLPGNGHAAATFAVTAPLGTLVRRARIAADLMVDGQPLGQQAEALVTVFAEGPGQQPGTAAATPEPAGMGIIDGAQNGL